MKHFVTLLVMLLLTACGTPHQTVVQPEPVLHQDDRMSNLAIYAMSLYDTPYQYGGKSRVNGFDCSGFVQYVYLNSVGLQLPRTSVEMSRIGMPLETYELKPGDLVFFNTARSPYSHVGIYVGENRFVHSPRTGKAIMLASLSDRYWSSHYNGARRISLN